MQKREKNIMYNYIYINIYTSFNNIIITVSNKNKNPLFWTSSGINGFKGAKKSTPFAAQRNIISIKEKIINLNIKNVKIKYKGFGIGKESIIRIIKNLKLNIIYVRDVTPIPHNGCRPKKKRRV
ncbi:30S ribosomal protein S11 [Candidatus Vidania fulgoroideorum]